MSAIRFQTTPKGGITHDYYISRKPEPLRTELKNVEFYRSGDMLYLDIRKGKEENNTLEF